MRTIRPAESLARLRGAAVKTLRLAVRLALVLGAVLVLLNLLATGKHPIPPVDYPGFETCTLPCWAGIIPGQTQTDASPDMMSMHLPDARLRFTQLGTQINFMVIAPDRRIEGSVYDDRGTVNSVRMMMQIPLWRLLDMLGTPECVSTQPGPTGAGIMTIWWRNADNAVSATLLVSSVDWNPSAEVFTLAVFDQIEICSSSAVRRWQGFAPLWFYRSSSAG